ncbi:acyltransferase family protein [Obesumbacterium proteus]|uniref:acyltransferase family protein n=1 Tax=Obesumbacterium proteus TaxID=82983 RepID=UPI001F1F4A35|nr:acyltransferase family protein [Obesumbacterium proteus]MCE9886237.1 acyltransferase [Obesumbacterium proteus]
MEFRKDINGLRAIAVIAVILFHFSENILPGGFSGVDIFFVISGFLMTKIIFTKLDNDNFNLWSFYCSRAKRIVPALFIACIFLLVIGWLFIRPSEYSELSKDIISSLTFVSNILYMSRSGYFDDSSVNNLLLHTWSLSVEWQFYIIYPILIGFFYKIFGKKSAIISIYVLTICSFLLSLYGTYAFPNETYFMFPMRAWAMLSGGIVYLLSNHNKSNRYLSYIGIAGVLVSFFIINKLTPWPGSMALLPVISASVIIFSNIQTNWILSNKISQYIGAISYELYIVHWPVLVITKKLNIELNIYIYIIFISVLAIALNTACKKTLNLTKTNIISYGITSIFSCFVIMNSGFSHRVPEQFRLTKDEFHKKYYGGANYPANTAFYINAKDKNINYIIIGDSFGLQYAKSLEDSGIKAVALFDHGCLILPNYSRYLNNAEDISCSVEYRKVKELMSENKNTPVIFASSWSTYDGILIRKGDTENISKNKEMYHKIVTSEIKELIRDGGIDRKYYIVGSPQPTKIDGFGCLAGNSLPGYRLLSSCTETQDRADVEINDILSKSFSEFKNVIFINPNDALCKSGKCKVIHKHEPVYTDGSHLSIFGAEIVTKHIIKNL